MSGFDYNRIGELRIRAERAEARAERLADIGDQMAHHIFGLGPISNRLRDEWVGARAWDGAPTGDRAHPTSRRGVKGEMS